jgi:hypothetical protein
MPELPKIDIQQKLDDALAGSEEAQKYVEKIWYIPDGAPVPPGVTHNLVLSSAADENLDLHLGIVATDETAQLADILLAMLNRPATPPDQHKRW